MLEPLLKKKDALLLQQHIRALGRVPAPVAPKGGGDACCVPRHAGAVGAQAVPAGRARLWALPTHLYCSILGTCFNTRQLRKLVARCKNIATDTMSDLAVHEEAVQLAVSADGGGRALHKALDEQHQLAIRRFDKARSEDGILTLWDEAQASGDIPGAYWAALTHRQATQRVRERVFGDVHMLSHLVGAANRADIRRLAVLEACNAGLAEKIERQQAQLRHAVVSRDDTIRCLNDQLAAQLLARAGCAATPAQDAGGSEAGEAATLRALTADLQRRLVQEAARRERTEARLTAAQGALDELMGTHKSAMRELTALQVELKAAECHLNGSGKDSGSGEGGTRTAVHTVLQGRTVLYVGGRPVSTQAIRDLVERAQGAFIAHDGGIEQRHGLLAGEVSRADVIVFPVDCISHEAALQVKRLCLQAGKRFHPLRSASMASFLAAMASVGLRSPAQPATPREVPA